MPSNIITLYENKGFIAKRKTAGELSGPCPWCGGKDRFTLFPGQGAEGIGSYWCRKCGRVGDAIQFIRDLDNLSFQEAKAALGLSSLPCSTKRREPVERKQPEYSPEKATKPSEAWQLGAGKIVFEASAQLIGNQSVQDWLQQERGLTLDTALATGLGWVPQDMYRPRQSFGLPAEIKENGKPRTVWIPQGLCIPVISKAGEILRVKFRVSPQEGQNRPKYIPLPQLEKCTVPLVLESKSGSTVWQVVESELDALLLFQETGQRVNMVAMGSASYRPDLETWSRLKAASRVLVSLDFDEAGNKAACQWWERHLQPGAFKLWPVPEGKDPCDSWRAGWSLREWVEAGIK